MDNGNDWDDFYVIIVNGDVVNGLYCECAVQDPDLQNIRKEQKVNGDRYLLARAKYVSCTYVESHPHVVQVATGQKVEAAIYHVAKSLPCS